MRLLQEAGCMVVQAFDAEALDYLLKPVTASRLERALHRIEARRGPWPGRRSRLLGTWVIP